MTDGRGKAQRAPGFSRRRNRGKLRFAPAALTQESREVITRQFVNWSIEARATSRLAIDGSKRWEFSQTPLRAVTAFRYNDLRRDG